MFVNTDMMDYSYTECDKIDEAYSRDLVDAMVKNKFGDFFNKLYNEYQKYKT